MEFNKELMEKEISREIVFSGKIFKIAKCKALIQDKVVDREIMLHSGGVGVLPIDEKGNVLLVQQYRYGASEFLWEIPAGKLEYGEDPYECAVRELKEETGCSAGSIKCLGKLNPSPAIMSEIIYIYLATDLKKGEMALDADEFLAVETVPFEKAVDMVLSGEITDAKTQIALLKAEKLLKRKNKDLL